MPVDADELATANYDDGNRAFLQAFMARGTLTLKRAKPILAAIFTAQDGEYPSKENNRTFLC
jgi:non-structural maintenance of chromosomes element 1